MKKLLGMLLVLMLALLMTATALAVTSGDYEYEVQADGTAMITRYNKYDGGASELTIPTKLDNYTVTAIGDGAFFLRPELTIVTIPDSVTSLGANPFRYCEALRSVRVSPKHPTLATIDGVLFNKLEKKLIWYPMTKTDEVYEIPKGILAIGESAFFHCTNLMSITIPDSVTTIGDYAFQYCTGLTSMVIPDNVVEIKKNPFVDCESLQSVRVSSTHSVLATIDGVLFNKQEKKLIWYPMTKTDEAYEIPKGILAIGEDTFLGCKNLRSVTIPDSVTAIGVYAFCQCENLRSVTIPDNVTTIGNYVFYRCKSLTSVTIPDSVTTIGERAFYWCESLTSITIPDSVTTIGKYALSFCSSLTSIVIPDSVTTIGDYAFFECESLARVTIPAGVTSIGHGAFGICPSLTLEVDPGSYAEQYANENKIPVTWPEAPTDWLNW